MTKTPTKREPSPFPKRTVPFSTKTPTKREPSPFPLFHKIKWGQAPFSYFSLMIKVCVINFNNLDM